MARSHSAMAYSAIAMLVCLSLSAATAAPLRGPRRMLLAANAALVANEPQFWSETHGAWLRLCATQKNSFDQELTGADAAQAAVLWNTKTGHQAAIVPTGFASCEGVVSTSEASCWNGVETATGLYFEAISCYTKPNCETQEDGNISCVGRK